MADLAAMYRRIFEEGMNQRRLEVYDALIADTCVHHNLPTTPGVEGFRQALGMFLSGFPDLRVTTQDVIVEGNKVAGRGSWSGTHQGEFMSIPATGKQVNVPFIDIWRVDNGKFADNWVQMDLLGLMRQLGVAG